MNSRQIPNMPTTMIDVGSGREMRKIAVRHLKGRETGLMWLGGYRSDMLGTKAQALEDWAKTRNFSCCRHDYSGHGESEGNFIDGTISRWLEESLAVFDRITTGDQILIGSSMGAWVALRMAQELCKRVSDTRLKGMLLLAPAPDFTHELMKPELTAEHKAQLSDRGFMEEVSQYSEDPNIYTKALFDDGDKNRVMTGLIKTGCPVHIIQGINDLDVPYRHAMKLLNYLPGENVTMTLVKDGDHRLSRDSDIALMLRSVATLANLT